MFYSSYLAGYPPSKTITPQYPVDNTRYTKACGIALAISSFILAGLSIAQWATLTPLTYAIGIATAATLAIVSLLCFVASCVILSAYLPKLCKSKSCPFQTFLDSPEPVIYANVCGDSLSGVIQKSIESAEKSIFLRAFNLSSPYVIKSLQKQAVSNRQITIHYQNFEERFLKEYPQITLVDYPQSSRKFMHQKALVIDEKYGWVGSANYTISSLNKDANVLVGCKSPELCQHIIQNTSGSFTINGQPAQYFSLLGGDKHTLLKELKQRIRAAQKTVRVAMWALTHIKTIQELQLAQQRGVCVEVMIDNAFSRLCLKRLRQNGCTFPVYRKSTKYKLHCKMCVIDQETLMIGSVNWSKTGFFVSQENMLLLDNLTPKQKAKVEEIWYTMLSLCERVVPRTRRSHIPAAIEPKEDLEIPEQP